MVERLQVKACSIGRILTNLEKKYNSSNDDPNIKKSPSGHHLFSSRRREIVQIQRIPPFNASKIRKSPSTEPAAVRVVDQDNEAPWPESEVELEDDDEDEKAYDKEDKCAAGASLKEEAGEEPTQ